MAFVRKKTHGKSTSYSLVESRRENGRIKQAVLAHLGPYSTIETAFVRLRRDRSRLQDIMRLGLTTSRRTGRVLTPAGINRALQSIERALECLCPLVGLTEQDNEIRAAEVSIEIQMRMLRGAV